jgi:hypothetical protein
MPGPPTSGYTPTTSPMKPAHLTKPTATPTVSDVTP